MGRHEERAIAATTTPRDTPSPLGALAGLAARVGSAQLTAAGVPPAHGTQVDRAALEPDVWRAGRRHAVAVSAAAGAPWDDRIDADVASTVTALGVPTELLLVLGGDDRALPRSLAGTSGDGSRNDYGLPLYDLTPRSRLSSCTATPPDGRTLAVADAWRRRALDAVVTTGRVPIEELRTDIVRGLLARLALPTRWVDRVLLSPSGTDVETLVTAIAAGAHGRPLLNVLVGAKEAGSGTGLAAAGRWFRSRAAFGEVSAGEPVAGFDCDRVDLIDVDVRDAAGRARRAFDVEAEIDAHVRDALDDGREVLVHVMAASKTELRQPSLAWVHELRAAAPSRVRVVVDAAQARTSRADVRRYLDAGASVFLTGSKAMSGPPFCGALVLDAGLLADARRLTSLPPGLASAVAQADLPPFLAPLADGWEPVNVGLLARWAAALDEWQRLQSWPEQARVLTAEAMIGALHRELDRVPEVQVLPDHTSDPTIMSFLIRRGTEWADKCLLRRVYEELAADGVYVGQPVEIVRDRMAALRVAVGAAALNRLLAGETPLMQAVHEMAAATAEHLAAAVARLPSPA